jgi:molybdopterin-guanine dinucleotide biosynthesis protein A
VLLPWSAVVLAGGRGARLDGVDKAGVEIGGRTLLEWVLDAVVDAREVVVVGDQVPTERPVTFTRESPRYGGPAAGLLTGLDALLDVPAYVAVVAVDMPRLTMATMRRLTEAALTEAASDCDGAVLVGPDGRRQLAVVVSAARLQQVRPDHEHQHDLPLWRLLAPLDLVEVPAVGDEHRDIDTWSDLRDLG